VHFSLPFTDGYVVDCPTAGDGFDYTPDDAGLEGIAVDLLKEKINCKTGNCFLDNDGSYLIRQRNLISGCNSAKMVKFSLKTNFLITYGQLDIKNKTFYVKGLIRRNNKITISYFKILLSEVLKIKFLNSENFGFATICRKKNMAHILYIKNCPLMIVLNREVQ